MQRKQYNLHTGCMDSDDAERCDPAHGSGQTPDRDGLNLRHRFTYRSAIKRDLTKAMELYFGVISPSNTYLHNTETL